MSLLDHAFLKAKTVELTESQRHEIITNLGCIADMSKTVSEAIADTGLNDAHKDNLAYTASLLSELIASMSNVVLKSDVLQDNKQVGKGG